MMMLNDMLVAQRPSAKFTKALAVIASALHPSFDALLPIPGKSKESCVLCSLTVRDFLWKVGFKDARLTTCYLTLVAHDADGKEVHSAGCGDHAGPVPIMPGVDITERPGYWNGHAVVEVPGEEIILDTTMFPMKRPAWPMLPGMIAAPIFDAPPAYGLERISGLTVDPVDGGNRLSMVWLRQPNSSWRDAPDTDRALRAPVVRALRTAFGNWRA